jgi:hypothetical protein
MLQWLRPRARTRPSRNRRALRRSRPVPSRCAGADRCGRSTSAAVGADGAVALRARARRRPRTSARAAVRRDPPGTWPESGSPCLRWCWRRPRHPPGRRSGKEAAGVALDGPLEVLVSDGARASPEVGVHDSLHVRPVRALPADGVLSGQLAAPAVGPGGAHAVSDRVPGRRAHDGRARRAPRDLPVLEPDELVGGPPAGLMAWTGAARSS